MTLKPLAILAACAAFTHPAYAVDTNAVVGGAIGGGAGAAIGSSIGGREGAIIGGAIGGAAGAAIATSDSKPPRTVTREVIVEHEIHGKDRHDNGLHLGHHKHKHKHKHKHD